MPDSLVGRVCFAIFNVYPVPFLRTTACSRLKLDGDWKVREPRRYSGKEFFQGRRRTEDAFAFRSVTKLFTRSDGKFYFPFEYVFYVCKRGKESVRKRNREEDELEENCTMTTRASPFPFLSIFYLFFSFLSSPFSIF